MKKLTMRWTVLGCWLVWLFGSGQGLAKNPAPNTYETGYPDIVRISVDLHQALEARQRQLLQAEPVFWDQVATPYVHPGLNGDGSNYWQAVHLSAGFLNFVVNLSHAKAIDLVQRGYLKRYLTRLAHEAGDKPLEHLPDADDARAWSFDTMNHQMSQFNQMVGALVGVGMAHHYLGHYEKYANQLTDAQNRAVPLNTLLKPDEWREAVLQGARNALDCGLGIEGMKTLLDAVDQMPTRPPWTVYFVPQGVSVAKLKRELEKVERAFFNVR
jgi:hypothetical protein